ncbi:LuxR family transcriptional regulator [Pseudomonas syringae pv. theae]|uniref:Transcriptional regulator, LuxR family n=6 Tax=Pseudomonas syringae group TaxID=136849 RepID=Q881Q0_PSESM|nr:MULTISPECIES: LuxR C-terminal-related transcriptional regulator [Pseudomonas syringae group]AAO56332.1 transcriptional regulator, LuxR family [Pseudomonas syringae pv. tomato str. DC3000]EGH63889.1 LuxR family transcriptional regulator [Pseudomonas syringae pv. actinidiae str. M302091]EPM42888.1 LuxR family transcriptional regulator [Pseudomonas syringae pv. actinidiae ICMP 19103]EPM44082.1 LuxR family transcriptional regulator [Pseudomonas syringae pv. actinidiae ICMP 19098]EPM99789.1 LuxR
MPNSLLPQIGRAIASIGSGHFSSMFHKLIVSQLAVDATHLSSLPQAWQTPPASAPTVFNETVTSARGTLLLNDSIHLYPAQASENFSCKISVFRALPAHEFSEEERRQLNDLSPLLFSILEKHVNALQLAMPGTESARTESFEERFHERLRETGLTLSERETQVCLGLLAGHTAIEQAERLALKVNTVGSYQRRAAIKLGISGRHSLMRWMYASSESNYSPC